MRHATATIWTMKPMNQIGRRKGRSHFSSLLTISDGNMIMELFSAIKKIFERFGEGRINYSLVPIFQV